MQKLKSVFIIHVRSWLPFPHSWRPQPNCYIDWGGIRTEPAAALLMAAVFGLADARFASSASVGFTCHAWDECRFGKAQPPLPCWQLRAALRSAEALAPRLGYASSEQVRLQPLQTAAPVVRWQVGSLFFICCQYYTPMVHTQTDQHEDPLPIYTMHVCRWQGMLATPPWPQPGWAAFCAVKSRRLRKPAAHTCVRVARAGC